MGYWKFSSKVGELDFQQILAWPWYEHNPYNVAYHRPLGHPHHGHDRWPHSQRLLHTPLQQTALFQPIVVQTVK